MDIFVSAEQIGSDPLCKAFVEIEGEAYLKSCVNPDKGVSSSCMFTKRFT